ncbi:hypothetical protein HY345_03225 [Candidatus Microgenomates bacterium]|nr:hypothetical protein [Candidatus Microgenomates bacterium]
MKKFFIIVLLIIALLPLTNKKALAVKSCAYCGQYFFLGDTKPMSECLRLKTECMKVQGYGGKADACMCAVDKSAYMEFLVQQAKQRTAFLFANLGMPFMPGIHLIDPDLRKEFFDPNTPLHRKIEISLGRSTDLIGGGLGKAINGVAAISKINDPKVSNRDKLITGIGQGLQLTGNDTLAGMVDLGQKASDLNKQK